jgi:hypothetical protein
MWVYSRAYHTQETQRVGGGTIEQGSRNMVGNGSSGYGCIGCICSSRHINAIVKASMEEESNVVKKERKKGISQERKTGQ